MNAQIWVNQTVDEYFAKIQQILGLSGTKPTIVFGDPVDKDGNPVPAATSGNIITVRKQYVLDHPDDQGMLIHEIAHSIQNIPGNTVPDKTKEAFADAVRYKLNETDGTGGDWTPTPRAQQLIDLQPWAFKAASQLAASGSWDPQIMKGLANGTITQDSWDIATNNGQTKPDPTKLVPGQNMSADQTAQYLGGESTGPTTAPAGAKPTTPAAKGFVWKQAKDGTWIQVPKGGSDTGLTKQQIANNTATFDGFLQTWGIDQNSNTDALVQTAATHGWNQARFLQELQKTPEFHDAFPGIFDKNGGLKMTPAAYLQQKQAYESIATQAGLNVGAGKEAWLFKNDVSVSEFKTRAAAISRIRDNADMFKAFGQQLKAEGVAPPGGLSKSDLFKFVLGQGNKEWYDSYNNTVSLYYGQQAGLAFGGNTPNKSYTALGAGVNEKIAGKGLSEAELSQGYKDLASKLTTVLPMSKIQKFGLSKQDLIELEFGGKRQAAVAQKVQSILANQENLSSAPKANIGSLNIASGGGTSKNRAQV